MTNGQDPDTDGVTAMPIDPDAMLVRMQSQGEAMAAAFSMTPEQLGHAAVQAVTPR